MKEIRTRTNIIFLVDDDDFERFGHLTWGETLFGYAVHRNNKEKRTFSLHRLIMGNPDNMVVDHINGNKKDCRKSNLRICTTRENGYNMPKSHFSTSKYKGVSWDKRDKKWSANIYNYGIKIFIGYFDDEYEAAQAYNQFAYSLFGEYYRPN